MAREKIDHSVLEDENILYIENDHIRLGVNLALGGVVTYLAEHGKPNLINSADWGRQVQMSFYSGPAPFEPNGIEVDEGWKGLGWNPIQCGDCYGHRSTLLEHRCENDEIYVRCIPMHWPLDNYPGECTFETWYKLNGDRVEVTARLNNARPDTTQYPARSQELPAVYTNGVWYKLVSYIGNEPFTGGPLTEICTRENGLGWPWESYCATEHWCALVDDDNYGLGVYNPVTNRFIGGYYGEKGVGGPKDGNTGYISPIIGEILDHDIIYTYNYTLIVGDLASIRAQAVELEAQQPDSLCWSFEKDRSHFTYRNITDAGLPQNGCLEFSFVPESELISQPVCIPVGSSRIVLDAAFNGGELPCAVCMDVNRGVSFRMGCEMLSEQTVCAVLNGDGERREHVLEISGLPAGVGFRVKFDAAGSAKIWSVRVE